MDAAAAEVHAVAVSTHHVAAAGNLSGDDRLLLGVAASTARFLQLDAAVVGWRSPAPRWPPRRSRSPTRWRTWACAAGACAPGRQLASADSRSARGTLGVLAVELAVVLAARRAALDAARSGRGHAAALPGRARAGLPAARPQPSGWSWLLGSSSTRRVRLGRIAVSGDTVRVAVGLAAILVAVDIITSRRDPVGH